jgi:DNA-binding response OmpR family regulator
MRKKILVVEDDRTLLELLRLSFRAAGFSVATASNGIEALKKARSVTPDAILLDLVLPELDGFAVCETLRRDAAMASVPIVAVTGLTSELSRVAGFECGATDFVSKPATPKELVSKIKHWLQHPPQGSSVTSAKAKHIRSVACVE